MIIFHMWKWIWWRDSRAREIPLDINRTPKYRQVSLALSLFLVPMAVVAAARETLRNNWYSSWRVKRSAIRSYRCGISGSGIKYAFRSPTMEKSGARRCSPGGKRRNHLLSHCSRFLWLANISINYRASNRNPSRSRVIRVETERTLERNHRLSINPDRDLWFPFIVANVKHFE